MKFAILADNRNWTLGAEANLSADNIESRAIFVRIPLVIMTKWPLTETRPYCETTTASKYGLAVAESAMTKTQMRLILWNFSRQADEISILPPFYPVYSLQYNAVTQASRMQWEMAGTVCALFFPVCKIKLEKNFRQRLGLQLHVIAHNRHRTAGLDRTMTYVKKQQLLLPATCRGCRLRQVTPTNIYISCNWSGFLV